MKNISKKTWFTVGIGILLFLLMDKWTFFAIITFGTLIIFLTTFHSDSKEKYHFIKKASSSKGRLILIGIFLLATVCAGTSANLARKAETTKQTKEAQALKEQNDAQAQKILGEINPLLNEGKIDDVQNILSQNQSIITTNQNLTDVQSGIQKLKDDNFLKITLVQMADEEFSKLQSNNLQKIFSDNQKLNELIIKRLSENSSQRVTFIEEVKEKERLQKEEAERVKKEAEAVERKKLIETQFSAWDGSHRNLTKAIKESMNDPDSYEHVETTYTDNGDHLIVLTKFRGKNGFGGTVLNAVKAKVSIEGDVLKILEQYP